MEQGQTRRILIRLFLLLFLALGCSAAGCARHTRGAAAGHDNGTAAEAKVNPLPRADPGYIQWLERQSMLGATQNLTANVSGTDNLWRKGSTQDIRTLLKAAANWLAVNPYQMDGGGNFSRAMARGGLARLLPEMGFSGLYLAPTGERGDIWLDNPPPAFPEGSNVTALRLDPGMGTDADFEALTRQMEARGIQLGGDIVPAATGLGPDFMLQARRASRFDGLYAMLAIPQENWDLLPQTPDPWECLPLKEATVSALAARGLLPERLARDRMPWTSRGGWAVTGIVQGIDGQNRRWVYRYSDSVFRPVLLWQDPSGQARRIFSASIIRHIGLQRHTLAGLHMEPIMGLEAAGRENQDGAANQGLTALSETAQEVHRYGGWAIQADTLPPHLIAAVQAGSTDLAHDSLTPAASCYALLTGDARPLARLLTAAQRGGLDFRRLAHGLGDGQTINWSPLLTLPNGRELVQAARQRLGDTRGGLETRVTPAAVTAKALRGVSETQGNRPSQQADDDAYLLLLSWRMGLPGLCFFSPQELTGQDDGSQQSTGSQGKPPIRGADAADGARLLFDTIERQWREGASILHRISRILRARNAVNLASGRLTAIAQRDSNSVAALTALPEGGQWLLLANYSGETASVAVPLPEALNGKEAFDIGQRQTITLEQGAEQIFSVPPRTARHILLGIPLQQLASIR